MEVEMETAKGKYLALGRTTISECVALALTIALR